MQKTLTIILLCLTMAGCTGLYTNDAPEIVKSQNDKREYRYIELDNGLKVVLISDPATDFSAASLDVYVGSGSDPKHRQGLAHFLEHMLFLGTGKYPEPDAYGKYLKENGGSHNAFTSFEHTNYFFDIKPEAFESALDRFSQFFIAPLLDEKYVEREKHAVHSEYKAGIQEESRRGLDVLRQVINPAHPYSQFSVGTLDTLSSDDIPIKEDLVRFYQKNYVANNMALAVLGREPLDRLEVMVKEKFSPVKSGAITHQPMNQPLFSAGKMPQWVYIKPEKNIRELSMAFPVPDQTAYYRSQPLDVIGHVLGHEGKGSLLSYLKEKNWAEGLSASQGLSYNGGGIFSIDVTLTEEGEKHQEEILLAVFQSIKRLQNEGLPRWVFDEISRINTLEFIFKENNAPQGYVLKIANALHYYPAQDVLSADYILDEYKPDLIQSMLKYLTLENCMVFVVTDKFDPMANSDFYDVPYKVVAMDKSLQAAISNLPLNDNIHLPEKNALLPDDLAVHQSTKTYDKPYRLESKEGIQLWHKPVQNFNIPKVTSYIAFRKENVRSTVESAVLLEIYVRMLRDSFNERMYSAQMAGLSLQLYAQARGITLKIDGFSDKQDELLKDTLHQLKNVRFEPLQFERVKMAMLKGWQNEERQVPYKKLMNIWAETLQSSTWSSQQKIEALSKLKLDSVKSYGENFREDLDVVVMTNGNLTELQSRQMMLTIEEFAPHKKNIQSDILVVKLPEQRLHKVIASEHQDAAYLLYWQAPDKDVSSQARYMLLGTALENAFFTELRTEQQLGYVVYTAYMPILTVPGLVFVVQSPSADVGHIHQSVMAFLQDDQLELSKLTSDGLTQLKQALIQQLLEKPLSLVEESESYWYDLAMENTEFDRKQRLADAISGVTINEWQDFISTLLGKPYTKMYLLSTPSKKTVSGFTKIDDVKSGDKVQFFRSY